VTELLFRSNSYLKAVEAKVTGISEDGGVELDRTVFYANSGGQPGDVGELEGESAGTVAIADTIHHGERTRILHVPADGAPKLRVGEPVVGRIDWDRRHRLMRMHSALHLLAVVYPFPITGAALTDVKGRIDFNMPDTPEDKSQFEERLNDLIAADHVITEEWITDSELDAHPELIRTLTVRPPTGQGSVRLIRIGSKGETIDLQPCGGTHVASTREIGTVRIGKIEKKGKQNRRVTLHFAEESAA
jgi:misacylated tRNA(Ala) deacylase